ncbi:MAG TPA: hypothetical protein VLF89_01515, partial [Candidatus Saccharimonadales bacterium]|nr:hypothetical protein [Candidatus Saccharimonadales bacterium]
MNKENKTTWFSVDDYSRGIPVCNTTYTTVEENGECIVRKIPGITKSSPLTYVQYVSEQLYDIASYRL